MAMETDRREARQPAGPATSVTVIALGGRERGREQRGGFRLSRLGLCLRL